MAKNVTEDDKVINKKNESYKGLESDKEKVELEVGDDVIKLSLNELKNEINDLVLFNGFLSYAGLQKQYNDAPNEKIMGLEDFKAKMEEFLKQPIYKEMIKEEV